MKSTCFQSARVSAPCCVCGHRPERTHITATSPPAMYCEKCCPVCNTGALPTPPQSIEAPLEATTAL
jgi:hypothetical protein